MLEAPLTDVDMTINPIEVQGIKIILLNLDKKDNIIKNTNLSYGIKKIVANRPGMALSL